MIDVGKQLQDAYDEGYKQRDSEIVRCKDCVYYHKADRGHPDTEWCKRLICGTVKPDFYCADGTSALTSEEIKARK